MKILTQAEQWPLRVAAAGEEQHAHPSPELDKLHGDFTDWWSQGVPPQTDNEYTPHDALQSWGNVEEYLKDRHGLSSHQGGGYWEHPTTIGMAKLHSMAQGKNFTDGYGDIPDDDLLQGAAMGLLKIRKQKHLKEMAE